MTDQEDNAHTDDLPLESAESEAIVGGHTSPAAVRKAEQEIMKLEKQGYVQEACEVDGTLMVNPHTHKRITVRY